MHRCALLLFFLLGARAAVSLTRESSADTDVEVALLGDDQCVSAGSGKDCALNALQMKKVRTLESEVEESDLEGEAGEKSEWLKDISVHVKNAFKKKLTPLQQPIVQLYGNLSVLDKKANYTMEEVENATGEPVVWNRKTSASELMQLLNEEDDARSGRRRHHSSTSLPPRARYVNKILIYLDKEMKAVWNLHTVVARKRFGIKNVVTSNPYGPGSSLAQEEAQEVEEKPKHEAITNKYQQQLENDYKALLDNIDDAWNKTAELRESLASVTAEMHNWRKLGALQTSESEDAAEDLQSESEGESKWLKDISVHVKNAFKKKLTPLQTPIVQLYGNLSALDKKANYTMEEVENATGEPVVWNRKTSASELMQLLNEEDDARSGRRRHHSSTSLPPRARYVNKILIYLDKEMKAVWNLHTVVARKRFGIKNVVTSNPYGPGSSLAQEEAQEVEEKPKHEAITNKYQQQLENDYDALLGNIDDAWNKTAELRESLASVTAEMHNWRKLGA